MPASLSEENFANYLSLLSRVDLLCGEITAAFAEEIVCKAGCSSCCSHLSLFPVEAANLVRSLDRLPAGIKVLLAGRVGWPESGPCPLLLEERCLVYRDRPVICRTHGLPLLTEVDGVRTVDCCPENFTKVASLPGRAVINLDTLNNTLVAINALFTATAAAERFLGRDRLTIAEIILLATDKELL